MPALNITIKKKTGVSEYSELYPTTIISQVSGLQTALDGKVGTGVVGQPNGVASLDGSGKVPVAQLPNDVFDSLRYYATINANSNLWILASQAVVNATSANRSAIGYYFVASNIYTITPNLSAQAVNGVYFETELIPAEEGQFSPTTAQTLEAGDWVVITKITGSGTVGSPYLVIFAIVNNTYEDATTAVKGIAQLSNSTSTATTGNNVVTDGVLNGLLAEANTSLSGTTNTNKLAPAAHHHDSLYLGINSNATSASQWATARTVTFATGTVTGSFSIDGTADVSNVALTYTGNEFYYTEGEAAVGDLVFETDV